MAYNPLSFDISSVHGPLLNHSNLFDDRIDMLAQVVCLNDHASKGPHGDYTHATLDDFLDHMDDCGSLVQSLMLIIEREAFGFQWTDAFQLHKTLNCLAEVRNTYNNLKIHNPTWVMESPVGQGWRQAEAIRGKFYYKPIPNLFLEYLTLAAGIDADAVNSLDLSDLEDAELDELFGQ